MKGIIERRKLVGASALLFAVSLTFGFTQNLTTIKYHIASTELRVSPPILSVPRGFAGSVSMQLLARDGSTNAVADTIAGAFVEATLRGPSFDARRLVGPVNGPLLLPPLNLVGDYQLDNIRLVDAVTGSTRMEATPSSVPVHVFDEVLVSRVTSRPLTYDEIRDKGIVIDESNFRAVEFEVGFVVDGKTIPIKFPVVAPVFQQSTEIIPKAELEAALVAAQLINQEIAASAQLPPELQSAQLNIEVQGINFQRVEDVEAEDLTLSIPPIPALMVVPGNIGFLNQFFSVQIFTENAAPSGSGLSVHNVRAELHLPPGPDRIGSTNYAQPGDDPLRFARVGPDKVIQPIVPVVRPGADGKAGTADDIERLQPGEAGQGEFLVEGLQEGLHVMDLSLSADLDGLAAGTVKVMGKAAGSVLVRNPKFSMAFTHPRTIRFGETYEASVTILNTSITPANEVSVTLSGASLSGGVLESDEIVRLGNIEPGQTATATWRVRAQRTGAISFSNLTTGDNGVQGRFRLRMGIDERGVALSPDTLVMPDFTTNLPSRVLIAATRVLGQALSVATAPILPAGVQGLSKPIITKRVLELAEAGQRLAYGDSEERVLTDLLLDWQGARIVDAGFDQILRTSDAGRAWREALMTQLEDGNSLDATARLVGRAVDLAGRGEAWKVASVSNPNLILSLESGLHTEALATGGLTAEALAKAGVTSASLDRSELPRAAAYRGSRGHWVVSPPGTNCLFQWKASNSVVAAELAVVSMSAGGIVQQFRWALSNVPAGTCYRFDPIDGSGQLLVDANGDGITDSVLAAVITHVSELAPEIISVRQDITVPAGRPPKPCLPSSFANYGTIVAVLFSKPMAQSQVNVPSAYRLDNGVTAGSVQIQPGGRVALLNLRAPISALRPRQMTISGVGDPRGNPVRATARPIVTSVGAGTAVRGRVVRADGSPAAAVPVTLTIHDENTGLDSCEPFVVRVCQVFTDENGFYAIDFVPSGFPYSISATDISGLPSEAVNAILEASVEDQLMRAKLEALIQSSAGKDTLLGAFAATALPQAIARAEDVDRAVLRDLVPVGSAREGTETPIALRFRGKGTVTGQVLTLNGAMQIPAPGAAVNLFPDPGSRVQPRGVFADSLGRFAFTGVPLGLFTIQAQNSAGLYRTLAGEITENGERRDYPIVLASAPAVRTGLQGRVLEPDNATPHRGARVFVGRYENGAFGGVVAIATADSDGYWSVTNVLAAAYDVVAVSFDGKRKGERTDVSAGAGIVNFAVVTLQGTSIVRGKVEMASGKPAANALVAGGLVLVRTDANGLFTLEGVPTGPRTISAALERNTNSGNYATRMGSASVNVVPGADNAVLIRLNAAGRIAGRVYDATGTNLVPNVRVALPISGGFQWVNADARGFYAFENMPLGSYTLSAPAPAAANVNTDRLVQQIRTGNEADLEAAIGEAFAIFTGAVDPFLNGEGRSFNPLTWGYASANLQVDGQVVLADIRYLRQGTIGGKVINSQSVPIGARVRLTGVGPMPNGAPGTVLRSEANSDPALGTFRFENAAFEGLWTLQAASPFYPTVITKTGLSLPPNSLNSVSNILQFPAVQAVTGRLVGNIYLPDGSPAGSNVSVRVNFGDLTMSTVAGGFYDSKFDIPQGGYSVTATNEEGLVGIASVQVVPGIINVCDVRLLGRGALRVTVLQADGTPVTNAAVQVEQGNFPWERASGATGTNGQVEPIFMNLSEGCYAVCAGANSGFAMIMGRSGTGVRRGKTNSVVVRLAPTGTIKGRFVRRDGTPVDAAQVAVGTLGYAITDTNGAFAVYGVPLGTYRLRTQNPVNGIGASTFVTLSFNGQTNEVRLVEQFRGEVKGYVINSYRTGYVPGAVVTLNSGDDLTPSRTVTTGPEGGFSFPGTPAATFSLTAQDRSNGRSGFNSGTLEEGVASLSIDVPIEPLGFMTNRVFHPDGFTPAVGALVTISGPVARSADSDANGMVVFSDLPLGTYGIRAQDRALASSFSAVQTNATVAQVGAGPDVILRLSGVGTVSGVVMASDGMTPAMGASVMLMMQTPLFYGSKYTTFTDLMGRYSFTNVAMGAYSLFAEFLVLATSQNGVISAGGENDFVRMQLGSSGMVQGRLVRADGVSPVGGVDVLLAFASQSTAAGYAVMRTEANGAFHFDNIPLGPFTLSAVAPEVNGIARLRRSIGYNLQILDLGPVLLDEENPYIVGTYPPNGAGDIPPDVPFELYFNEPMDPATLDTLSIYICSANEGMIPTVLQLVNGVHGSGSVVRGAPQRRLSDESTYEIIVLDKPYRGGTVIQDLVGRSMSVSFLTSFTTGDQKPPQVVSLFPSNNAVQIDPRGVIRVAFNEPVRLTNASMLTLRDSSGALVAGQVAMGLNNLIATFTPTVYLEPNQTYSATVLGGPAGVHDMAGNFLPASVTGVFATVDTLGPAIRELRLVPGSQPVAGATVPFETFLLQDEPGAQVRFTRDFEPAGAALNSPYVNPVQLGLSGTNIIRAIAMDRFGNEGPVAELSVAVVSNQPPAVQLKRGNPPAGPVLSGQIFTVNVSASDDYVVSNITVLASGPFSFMTNLTGGATQAVSVFIPPEALPGVNFEVRAQAVDGLGKASALATLDFTVSDGSAPIVNFVTPPANTLLNTTTPLQLVVSSRDNAGSHSLEATLSGALNASAATNITAGTNVSSTSTFAFALGAAQTNGTPLVVTVRGQDQNGNSSLVTRQFRLPDSEPPRLVSVTPRDLAVGQSLWLSATRYEFNEAVSTNSARTDVFVLQSGYAGFTYQVDLDADPRVIRVRPLTLPLVPGASYTNLLLPGVFDVAGNPLVQSNASPWPSTGRAFSFKAAEILSVTPGNGASIVPGQTVAVSVGFEAGLGADFVRLILGEGPPVDVPAGGNATNVMGFVRLDPAAVTATLFLAAHKNGYAPYNLAPLTFNVRSRSGDDDGDGWENGFEADRGMNPFLADVDSADFDNDGLTNGDERTRGTDPAKSDSDGDSLFDGTEVLAGTNPLSTDTDSDGLRDDVDPSPTRADTPPVLTLPQIVYVQEGQLTNITVSASDADGNLRELQVGSPTGAIAGRWQELSTEENAVVDAYMLRNNVGADLISWWRAEGNANDFLGRNHGILRNGVTFAPGRVGSAFSLDGVDDYIEIPNHPSLNPSNQISIAAWWQSVSFLGNGNNSIVDKGYPNHVPPYYQYHLGVSGDQIPSGATFVFNFATGATSQGVGTSPRYWMPAQWYHLVGTYDGGTARFYVNGRLISTASVSGLMSDFGRNIRIGGFSAPLNDPGAHTPGLIDEVRIYSRALTAMEVGVLSQGLNPAIVDRLQFGNGPVLPRADVSQSYSNRLTASPGFAPYTYSAASGLLPSGLTLSSDGLIQGTPTAPGFSSFLVRVTDGLGLTGEQLFGLRVGSASASVDPSRLVIATNAAQLSATLLVNSFQGGTSFVQIIARDVTDKQTTNSITVVATQDQDHDGFVNANDQDVDGDGLANATELAAGTDTTNADTDWDDIPDHVDRFPLAKNRPPVTTGTTQFEQLGTADILLTLNGSDPDEDAVTPVITTLPAQGALYQTPDGTARGARITATRAVVSNPEHKVIFAPTPGATRRYVLGYQVTDRYLLSGEQFLQVDVTARPGDDFDGDGLPDVYEFQNGLNAELADAELDIDGDGLSNIREYQLGARVTNRDTDNDGLVDGLEVTTIATNGASVFVRDWDQDGLPDGSDPAPTLVVDGVTINAISSIALYEGQSTNVLVTALWSNAPLALLDLWPTNPSPAFVSWGNREFTNDSSGWMANGEIWLNPLHDAAGEYTLSFRATARDGTSGRWNLNITVLDVPTLLTNYWIGPITGTWSNPLNWSRTVPQPNHVAVIDAVGGNYSVVLDTSPACQGIVINSTNANLWQGGSVTINCPVEIRAGSMDVVNGALTLNQALHNRGILRQRAGDPAAFGIINGTGRIENGGRYEFSGNTTQTASGGVNVPVSVPVGGRLIFNPSAWLIMNSARLCVAGAVEVTGSAGWSMRNSSFVQAMAPAEFTGDGFIGLESASGMEVLNDIPMGPIPIVVGSAGAGPATGTVGGPGEIRLTANGYLYGFGRFHCPLRILPGVFLTSYGYPFGTQLTPEFHRNVTIEAGATLTFRGAQSHHYDSGANRVNGTIANHGTINLLPFTGYDTGYALSLFGSGQVENFGVINVINPSAPSVPHAAYVSLPVTTHRGSRIVVGPYAPMSMSVLTNAALFEIREGSTLSANSVLALEGAEFVGSGTVFCPSLEVAAGAEVPMAPTLFGMAQGPGRLVFTRDIFFSHPFYITRIDCASTVASGVTLTVGNLTVDTMTIAPGAKVRIAYPGRGDRISASMGIGSVVTNYGTIEMWMRSPRDGVGGVQTGTTIGGGPGSRLENHGLIDVYPYGPTTFPSEGGSISVGCTVHPAGRIVIHPKASLAIPNLDVAGSIAIEHEGSLTVGGVMTVLPGAVFSGSGRLLSTMLNMVGDATFSMRLQTSLATNTGTITLLGEQSLGFYQTYRAPLRFSAGSIVSIEYPIIEGAVTIDEGAKWIIDRSLLVWGTVTNNGVIEMWSRNGPVSAWIGGRGHILNQGRIEVLNRGVDNSYAMSEASITVASEGSMVFEPGARFTMRLENWYLGIAGRVELPEEAELNAGLLGSWPGLVEVAEGGVLTGRGNFNFAASSRLVVSGAARWQPHLRILDRFVTATGNGLLTFTGDQTLTGGAVNSQLATRYDFPIRIAAGVNVLLSPDAGFKKDVFVEEGATLTYRNYSPNRVPSLDGRLTNHGTVRVWSMDPVRVGAIEGDGSIHNFGRLEFMNATGQTGGGWIYVPVTLEPGSSLVIPDNSTGDVYGKVTHSGVIDVGTGAVLYSSGSIECRPGAEFVGAGIVRVHSSTLEVDGDVSMLPQLNLTGTSSAVGKGTLSLLNTQNLTRVYGCPLVIAPEAFVNISDASFTNGVIVAEGSVLAVPGGRTLQLDGILTNYGTLRLFSGDTASSITTTGPGCIVNPGSIRVMAAGSGQNPASVCVPIVVATTGELALEPGARLSLCDPAFLSVAGRIDTGLGSVLSLPGNSPSSMLALYAGATLTGSGTVRLEGNSRLLVLGRSTVAGGSLDLLGQSTAAGFGRLIIDATSQFSVNHSLTMPGVLEVRGRLNVIGAATTFRVGTSLLLGAAGTIINEGAILAGGFENAGGVVLGQMPTVTGPVPPIAWIILTHSRVTSDPTGPQLAFDWTAVPQGRFEIQASSNLTLWLPVTATILEAAPGLFEGRVPVQPGQARFFRVRQLP